MGEERAKDKRNIGIQLVTFRLGSEYYGTPVWMVREIIRPIEVFQVPGMRGPVEGVINLRGVIIPVLKIHAVLGAPCSDSSEVGKKQRIVILDSGDGEFGFMVDDVMEVVRVASEDVKPPPEMGATPSGQDAILGIVQLSGRLIICIDPRQLVTGCMDLGELTESCTE
ncbi:MAG: purine-binding chemotaxis protein CheW [bacterium]|nr:MAG: purine-binding chemotaxis protein CheW [bacterium]